jgi:FMN phosphatase YigB (HAD superfamily)
MTKKYDALVFDLGGVLYDIDVQRTIDAFAGLGLPHFERIYTLKEQAHLIDALEKGLIDADGFIAAVNRLGEINLIGQQVKTAWDALLIGIPMESVELLQDLRKTGYKLYLLSNTNIFHYTYIQKEMKEKFGINHLDELFDASFYSFKMGMRKPDAEIYHKVLADINMPGANMVFIDDNADNIRGAIAAGLPGLHLPKNVPLQNLLKEEGII